MRSSIAECTAEMTTEPAPCVRDSIRAALYAEDRETDTYIVDRLKGGVDIPKKCATEEQRQHYRLALSLVAPVYSGSGQKACGRMRAETVGNIRGSPVKDKHHR